MNRIEFIWLDTEPMDMYADTDTALDKVIAVSLLCHLFADRRATRIKVLAHDGFESWLAARRLNQGKLYWFSIRNDSEMERDTEKF